HGRPRLRGLILTCFGDLPPDRQLYLGMGTMIVKETIRSALGETYRSVGVWVPASSNGKRDAPLTPAPDMLARRHVSPNALLPGNSIPSLFHTVSREFGLPNWLGSILISIYLLELVGASA